MQNLSLNTKIFLAISIFLISNIVTVYVGLHHLALADESMDMVVHTFYRRIHNLTKMEYTQTAMGIQLRDAVLDGTPDGIKKIQDAMTKNKEEQHGLTETFIAIADQHGKETAATYKTQFTAWFDAAVGTTSTLVETKNKDTAFTTIKEKTTPLRIEMTKTLEHLIEQNEKNMENAIVDAGEDYKESRNFLLLISLVCITTGSVFAFFTLRSTNREIRNVITSLNNSSGHVASATQTIAATSEQLSASASEQAASLEETSASMEELSSMVKVNSSNAAEAAKLSKDGRESAVKGEKEIQILTSSMDKIQESSKRVEEVIKVIDDIAFQTNLLALNAAVEAARAGEQGKGFAVVADAVRTLAQKSAESAKAVSELIKSTVHDVQDGAQATASSATLLGSLAEAVKKISALNEEIASASSEQANGLSQINQAMNQLDQTTQQNAAASEEASGMSQELAVQAETLREAVERLVDVIDGKKKSAG